MPEPTPSGVTRREPDIERLIQLAELAARDELIGLHATPDNLARMACLAVSQVRRQADLGLWARWSIADAGGLGELDCRCVVVRHGGLLAVRHSPYVAFEWDWKRSALPFLATWSGPPAVSV